jgi:hypothetical protein
MNLRDVRMVAIASVVSVGDGDPCDCAIFAPAPVSKAEIPGVTVTMFA